MKKNVKYIGSAVAVALLAAGAPVVIDNIVPTANITVKADGQNNSNPDATPTEMLKMFKSQFDNRYVSDTKSITDPLNSLVTEGKDGYFYFGPVEDQNAEKHLFDLQRDEYLDKLKDTNVTKKITDSIGRNERALFRSGKNDYFYYDILGYVTISAVDSSGKLQLLDTTTPDALQTISNEIDNGEIQFPLTINIYLEQGDLNPDGTLLSNGSMKTPSLDGVSSDLTHVSFTISLSRFDITEDTDNPTVAVGSEITNSKLNSGNNSLNITDNFSGDDAYATSLSNAEKPNYGQSVFTTKQAAINYAKSSSFDPSSTSSGNATTDQFDGTTIKLPGTYYQTVTYNLKGDGSNKTDPVGADPAIGYMLSGKPDNLTNTVIQPYHTRINGAEVTNNNDEDYIYNQTAGTLSIVRKFTVGSTLKAQLQTPSVNVGSKVADLSTDGNKLVGNSGSSSKDVDIPTSDITTDGDYYTDADADATDKVTDEISNGVFKKAGKYYRKLTFTLAGTKTTDYSNILDNVPKDTTDTTVTYIQEVDVKAGTKPEISSPTVFVGDATTTATSDNDLLDSDGNSLLDKVKGYKGVDFGTTYYEIDPTKANKAAILDGKGENAVDGVVSADNTTFDKAGTYLRTITFYLTKSEIANNAFDTVDPNVKVSVENSSVTYVQQIIISKKDNNVKLANPEVTLGTKTDSITVNNPEKYSITDKNDDKNSLIETNADGSQKIDFLDGYYNYKDGKKTPVDSSVINNNNRFVTSGTYYREVKIYLKPGTLNKYNFGDNTKDTDSNGDESVTYLEPVTVLPQVKAKGNIPELNVVYNTDTTDGVSDEGIVLSDTAPYTLTYTDSEGTTQSITPLKLVIGGYFDDEALSKLSSDISAGKFDTDGKTYYRAITFTLPAEDGYAYLFPDDAQVDKENDNVKVTFIQKVTVDNRDGATATFPSTNISFNSTHTIPGKTASLPEITVKDDGSNESLINGAIVAGTNFYDNPESALVDDGTNTTSHVIKDGKLFRFMGHAGDTVYRKITVNLNSGAATNYLIEAANDNLKEGTNYVISGDTIIYAQPFDINTKDATVTIGSVNVNKGDSVDISESSPTSTIAVGVKGLAVLTPNIVANIININSTKTITYPEKYYDGIEDYTNKNEDTDVLKDGKFAKDGTFYREVTVPLKAGYARGLNFANDLCVRVDEAKDTVTYLQVVNVTTAATSNITGITTTVGTDISKLGVADGTTDITTTDGTTNTSIIDSAKNDYGNQYFTSASDALNNIDGKDGKFTTTATSDAPYYRRVTLTLTNGDASAYKLDGTEGKDYVISSNGTTITFAQPIIVAPASVTSNITDPVTVESDHDIATEQGKESNKINDADIVASVTFGAYYPVTYTNESAALADILSGKTTATTDPVNGTAYGKTGTYYRKVILHLTENALNSYNVSDVTAAQINKTDNTITYIQKVTITPNITKANAEVNAFINEFENKSNSDDVISFFDKISNPGDDFFDTTKSTAISTVQNDTNISTLMTGKTDIDTTDLDDAGVKVSFSAVDKNDKQYTNAAQIEAALKDNSNLPLTITGTLTAGDGVKLDKTSFTFEINALSYAVSLDNREGTVGNAEVTDSKDTIVATDTKEASSVFGNATPVVGKYYNSVAAALAGGTDGLAPDAVKDSKYETAGNYYQAETFTLTDGSSTPANAYTYTINGKTAILNTDYAISADGKTITFVRKVDVSLNSEAINDDAKDFENQFKTTTNNDDVIKAFETIAGLSDDYFATGKATATSTLQNDENIKTLLGSSLTNVDTAELDSAGVTVTFTATDNNGKTYASAAEIATALKANPNLPLTINGKLSSSKVALTDTDLKLTVNVLDYNATIDNNSKFTMGEDAPTTSDDTLNSTVTNAATFGTPTLSKTYYNSAVDALNGENPVSAVDANGKLIKSGDLYQTETFTISDSSGITDITANAYGYQLNGVAAKAFDGKTGDYIISDGGKTITFARKITVNANDSAVASEAKDFADQFGDLNNTNDVISTFKNLDAKYLDATNPVSIADVQADTNLQKLLKQTSGSLADLIDANGKVTFKISSNGKELTTPVDIVAALENTPDMPVTITAQITTDDQNAKLDNNGQFSFKVSPLTYTATVPDVSGKTNNPVATSTDGYTVTASTTGVSEILDNPTFGKYYADDNGTKGTEDDDVVSGTNYAKAGDYYQEVMFHVEGDVPASAYAFSKDGKILTLGTDYTVSGDVITFLRKVHIDTSSIATPSLTKEVTVNAGSKVSDDQNSETNDIKNDNNESIVDHVDFGKIYTDASGKDVTTDAVDGDTYKTPETYYREVILTLKDGALDTNTITGLKDAGATQFGNTVTFTQKITVSANAATVNTDKVTSTVGSPVSSLPAVNGNYTLNLADKDKTPITTAKASTDGIVYRDYDSKTKQLSDPVTSFDSTGTYYRVISLKTADADKYSFADTYFISNKDGVITYVQPISVGKESDVKVGEAVTATKSVKVNISGENSALMDKTGYSLTGANNKDLIDAPTDADGISFSPEYYSMVKGVLTLVSSADAHDYTISKKGIYYRMVIFKVSADTIANYDFNSIGGTANKDNTVSFIQKVDASTKTATVKLTSPSVSYNTSANSSSLKVPTGVTLKDGADKDINSGTPELSGIFSTEDAAKNATSDTGDVTGNLTDGPYYQRVTFPLSDNDSNAYDFGDGVVPKDGKSVTYIRTITVKPNSGGSSGNSGNNSGSDAGNNGSGDEDEWTYYKDPGVVTTKTTQPSYSLNNRANETVENRALAQDTSWITDQYRTNKAGVKQYRVATGEWIDSHDVVFNGQTVDEEDGWTYYKDPGIVVTKPDQEYYSLNNRANDTIKNRALMEKTSWITDQYRTNRQGVKQYRVATNEWIDSHDVIFTKNVKQIVNVDETAPYYSLYTIYGQLVQNRALEQKTSWFSDKVAYADDGTVYYRVATNEWVKQIDGVHLASYAWYKY